LGVAFNPILEFSIAAHLDVFVGTAPNFECLHMPPLWSLAVTLVKKAK
jgi:hypothetical protein